MIIKNGKNISAIFKGSTPIVKVYKGLQVVWEAFKKLIVRGALPLTLIGSAGKPLVNYKIEGDGSQRNKNIFPTMNSIQEMNGITLSYDDTDGTYTLNGTSTTSRSFEIITVGENYQKFNKGDTYTLSASIISGTTGTNYGAYIYIKDSYTNSNYVQKTVTGVATTPYTFTYEGDGYINRIAISISGIGHSYENYKFKIQLEKGAKATDFIVPLNPTLDTPVEVQSVGDKTYNLIDFDPVDTTVNGVTIEQKADGSIVCDGTAEADIAVGVGWVNLKSGIRYRGTGCPTGGSTSTYRLFFNYLGADLGNGSSATLMTADQRSQVRLFIYSGQVCDNLTFYPMLTEVPDTTTKYPYKKAGYEIPITVGGKNLFDKTNMYTMNRNASGLQWTYNAEEKTYYASGTQAAALSSYALTIDAEKLTSKLKSGHKYLLAGASIPDVEKTRFYVFATHKSGSKTSFISSDMTTTRFFTWTDGDTLSPDLRVYSTDGVFREITNAKFQPMLIDITNMSDDDIANVIEQFEEYVEPTTTSIYLDEPLRKVGSYADYIDFENKKVVRNVAVANLGTSWSKYSTYNIYFTQQFTDAKYATNISCFCNYYKGQVSGSGTSYKSGNAWFQNDPAYKRFYLSNDDYTTLDSIKIHLAELSAAGTPVEVTYVLNTPTEETIELPEILTNKGTNVINVETTIQPSNVEVTYKGK